MRAYARETKYCRIQHNYCAAYCHNNLIIKTYIHICIYPQSIYKEDVFDMREGLHKHIL